MEKEPKKYNSIWQILNGVDISSRKPLSKEQQYRTIEAIVDGITKEPLDILIPEMTDKQLEAIELKLSKIAKPIENKLIIEKLLNSLNETKEN